jgi:protocatechuate 3,4-dioxygenase beta subunit
MTKSFTKLHKITLLIFTYTAFFCLQTQSSASVIDITTYNQSITTPNLVFEEDFIPKKFNSSNNLSQLKNSYLFAKGKKLIIEGEVTSADGSPLSDIMIFIWQANDDGFYQSQIKNPESKKIDPYFSENGSFITDNLGKYRFLTIFPGEITKTKPHCPHINFLIKKDEAVLLQTKLFFSNIANLNTCDNTNDFKTLKLSKDRINLVQKDIYYIDSRDKDIGYRVIFDIKLDVISSGI